MSPYISTLWIKKIYHWLLPHLCILCSDETFNRIICEPCLQDLPWLENACPQCGSPMPEFECSSLCGACLTNPPPYHSTIALFHYQSPIDYLISALKFHKKLIHAKLLGELMADRLAPYYMEHKKPDLIIPIPLHTKRLQERGFNQALEIAKPLAKRLNIPINRTHCVRNIATRPQSSVSASERYRNLKNAFTIKPILGVNHVAIVDDVMTTGNTVMAFTLALQKAGIPCVDVLCCARTLLRSR